MEKSEPQNMSEREYNTQIKSNTIHDICVKLATAHCLRNIYDLEVDSREKEKIATKMQKLVFRINSYANYRLAEKNASVVYLHDILLKLSVLTYGDLTIKNLNSLGTELLRVEPSAKLNGLGPNGLYIRLRELKRKANSSSAINESHLFFDNFNE